MPASLRHSRTKPANAGQVQWRLDLAADRLRTTDQPVESIAAAVGYHSAPAFSRAFTRSHGAPPGRYRTMHRPSRA
ncbi:helix-turn-helix domain-containing protein [Micromonospora haikouensis]|uniref:helix-turn-helix domain-containing protein n=1 Tax=Micromonospora haikouensis TaxID=686309 RepID=UPI0037B97BA9